MSQYIAHGNGNNPVCDKGDVGDDTDVFIAAQHALDRRTHSVTGGKDKSED